MKKKLTKKGILIIFAILSVVIFLAHWGYSIFKYVNVTTVTYSTPQTYNNINVDEFYNGAYTEDYLRSTSSLSSQNNIASGKVTQTVATQAGGNKSITVDQKYEKTADMASVSKEFNEDKEKIKAIITQLEAVVQEEQQNGLQGSQYLSLTVGVMPEKFDSLVEEVKQIGELKSFSVVQVDKTQQYLELKASRENLEAKRQSYVDLKDMAQSVEERIQIEEKISELDSSIRNIDVNVGVYSDEYSFCTVVIGLSEIKEIVDERHIQLSTILYYGAESFWFTLRTMIALVVLVCLCLLLAMFITFALGYIERQAKISNSSAIKTNGEDPNILAEAKNQEDQEKYKNKGK